jgi:hypothetical protein
MRYVVSISLLVAAIIHLLPLVGVLGGDRLQLLYGVAIEGPDLQILMRHRAVLFGLLGTYLLVAAFMPALQPSALAVGLVSVLSFLLLAWTTDGYNASIARVVTADVIALVALLIGTAAYFIIRSKTWPGA